MSDNFKVLSEIEHALARPAMYIGSVTPESVEGWFCGEKKTLTVVPGLLKIVFEIVDNSVDEFIRTGIPSGSTIWVDIQDQPGIHLGYGFQPTLITIKDNGRGIPVEPIGDSFRPVVAWTKPRAGSNFDSNRTTIGANGVGSFCTNVFSSSFKGTTDDGKRSLTVQCEKGTVINVGVTRTTGSRGTSVSFVPDLSVFGLESFTIDHLLAIEDRLETIQVSYPGIKIVLNGKQIKVRTPEAFTNRINPNNIAYSDSVHGDTFIGVVPTDGEHFSLSYVNGLTNRSGGTHIDYIANAIILPIREFVSKKHKIDVSPSSIRSHLGLVVFASGFEDLKFDSQTKDRVTNTRAEVSKRFGHIDFAKIAKKIVSNEHIIGPMIDALLFKKEQQERAELAKATKNKQKQRIVNHIAATHPDPMKRTLIVCEGLSAVGQAVAVRDPKLIGAYPLKGKVVNVRGMKPIEILKNKEVSELLTIIGLEFGKPAKDLNYGTIGIMTDSDKDGDGIFCLLLNLLSFWPELFEQGRIVRYNTPIVIARKGKREQWFYNLNDVTSEYDTWDKSYNKGIGTLTKEAYKKCLTDPVLTKVVLDPSGSDSLDLAFGDNVSKRKEWLLK